MNTLVRDLLEVRREVQARVEQHDIVGPGRLQQRRKLIAQLGDSRDARCTQVPHDPHGPQAAVCACQRHVGECVVVGGALHARDACEHPVQHVPQLAQKAVAQQV
jgi:hypothetical protein